jgi:hypothetical protein
LVARASKLRNHRARKGLGIHTLMLIWLCFTPLGGRGSE